MQDSRQDFFQLVKHQRAYRRFADKPVDDALIERLLEAAVRAPSAENRQPWEFVVLRDAESRAAIGNLMARAWESGARQWSETRLAPNLLADVDAGMRGGIAAAPVVVVVCGNTAKGLENTLAASVYPAVQNLLLAATAAGLGSALTTLAIHNEQALRQLLQLPDSVRPMAVIPIGYPERPLGISRRHDVRTCTHRNRFGVPW